MDHRTTQSITLPSGIVIRPYDSTDDIQAITSLLHRAYKPLADMGLRYMATHQSAEITRERLESGESFVALQNSLYIGTISLYSASHNCEYYKRDGVYHFGQFGVDPSLQRMGIGREMLKHVEQRAQELHATEMALDTAQPAVHLIAYYQSLGYNIVDEVQWPDVNYRSFIMSKLLSAGL